MSVVDPQELDQCLMLIDWRIAGGERLVDAVLLRKLLVDPNATLRFVAVHQSMHEGDRVSVPPCQILSLLCRHPPVSPQFADWHHILQGERSITGILQS